MFIFGSSGLARPEVTRHIRRLEMNYRPPGDVDTLLLASPSEVKPISREPQYRRLQRVAEEMTGCAASYLHICFYTAPFGVVPVELSETYPLSQFEAVEPLDGESIEFAAEQAGRYVEASDYSTLILHRGLSDLDGLVEGRCREACLKKGIPLTVVSDPNPWGEEALERLIAHLKEARA